MRGNSASLRGRELLGLLLALVSAVALIFLGLKMHAVSQEAGADVSTLRSERFAVDYNLAAKHLLIDLGHFRAAVVVGQRTFGTPAQLSADIDETNRVVSRIDAQEALPDVSTLWRAYLRQWRAVRAQTASNGVAEQRTMRALLAVIFKLEDSSRLTYDPNIAAQNLADMTFAKYPTTLIDVSRAALIALKFVREGQMKMADRMQLAVVSNAMRNGIDLTADDLDQTVRSENPSAGQNDARIIARAQTASKRARAFQEVIQNRILMADRPGVDATKIRAVRDGAIAAISASDTDLLGVLRANLDRRLALDGTRRLVYWLLLLFAGLLLLGLAMEAGRLTARRERQLLRQAQADQERLRAELAREQAEKALRLTEAQFRTVFDGSAMGIAIVDRQNHVINANAVFRDNFALDITRFLEGHEEEVAALFSGEQPLFEFERHYVKDDNTEVWADATVSVVSDEHGVPEYAMCMFRDVTELRRSERRMAHDLTHDALTGLPNRMLFEMQLHERFAETTGLLDSFFAVLMVDLDHFKDFNETLGHRSGDAILQTVAQRLRASIDPNDFVGRLGSDEFAILIRSLGDILHVESVARRIINNVGKPVQVGDRSVFCVCSVGVAIGSATYERAEDVLRDANLALHHAKSTGGSRYALFDSNMHASAERRLQLTTDMRLAIERGEFMMLYQPIVRIADAQLMGCEALIRWNHPTQGLVLPNDFMPLAEQTGLAVPIGRFVFETACAQLAKWRRNWRGAATPPFFVSVNVSAGEIFDPDFENFVRQTAQLYSIDPREVTLEITESVVLDSNTRANVLFERLKEEGFHICIDDFGTGYSSLRYLQQFNIDALKIDRSFVASETGEVASEPIVRTLMTLAEAFDLRVVAEGVESQRQRDTLRAAGCRFAQGFFYARPLTADELTNMYPEVLGLVSDTPATA